MTEISKPTPLIFDDDGSQDGMTALAYMLANPEFDVEAITIANGIARPETFADNLKRMLGRLDYTDIPIGVGRSTPLAGNNEFPDFIRDGADTFWTPFVTLPEEVPAIETESAAELIIETINSSPEPVAILATGPLTNIAEALRQEPSIIDNISVLQVMGGALDVPGNLPVLPDPPFSTNETAEFNIWVDPVAAQEVFAAGEDGLEIQLTPLDATNQIEFDRENYQDWLDTGTPESEIAAEFLDFALEIIQSDNDPNPVWDLVAAINLAEPDFSPETPVHIDVDTASDPGENQGQTSVVEDLPPNVLASLNPSFANIPFDAGEVFSYLELPVVNFSADRTAITEGGQAQLLTFHLSEPAPEGELVINLNIDDPDGEGADTEFPSELISNIVDFGQVEENGVITASLTIAEGSTEATFGIAALEDELDEGNETYSLTLLEDESYRVDPASTAIITTIEEAIASNQTTTVSLTPESVIATERETFAWNFSLDRPAPEGGLSLVLSITDNNDPAPGDVEYNIDGSSNIADFEFVTASDESISQIYAFGDSYSDDGRSLEISTEAVNAGVPDAFILPADPELGLYDAEGRWTNGETAVEVLAQNLGVGLTNYAVGGAKSGNGNYYSWLDSVRDTGVFGQIDQFTSESSGTADPDALYFIFASANDFFEYADFGLPGTVEELAAQTVENIADSVTELAELGAEQFLVVNSSDLDILPGVIEFGQAEEAELFVDEVNSLLPQELASLEAELDVDLLCTTTLPLAMRFVPILKITA
ncbi:nucleoside hydrolase [Myxosarcina sp. GI1(2024)]